MSNMNELSTCIADLKSASASLLAAAETLTALYSSKQAPAVETPSEVSAPRTVTKEEVRAVLAAKSASGYTAQVRALLKQHGASQLSAVNPDEYADLLQEASAIGDEVRSDA